MKENLKLSVAECFSEKNQTSTRFKTTEFSPNHVWGKSKELSFYKMNEKAQPSGHISNMKWKQQNCQMLEDELKWSEEQRKEMEE